MTKRKHQSESSVEVAPKYEPTEREASTLAALNARARAATRFPRLVYRDGGLRVDHEDEQTGVRLMMQACGASSADSFAGLVEHLVRFCGGEEKAVEMQVNALVAGIASIGPRDDTEMMLAAQMVLAHELSMKMARQVRHADTIPQPDSAERGFNKMTRTYTTQMEALRKHRHGGQQKVTVEHVTVNSGGQAIVGTVETRGEGRTKWTLTPCARPKRLPDVRQSQSGRARDAKALRCEAGPSAGCTALAAARRVERRMASIGMVPGPSR